MLLTSELHREEIWGCFCHKLATPLSMQDLEKKNKLWLLHGSTIWYLGKKSHVWLHVISDATDYLCSAVHVWNGKVPWWMQFGGHVHCCACNGSSSLVLFYWCAACLWLLNLLLFLLVQMPRQAKALRFNNNVPVFVSMWQVNIVKVYPRVMSTFFCTFFLHCLHKAQHTRACDSLAKRGTGVAQKAVNEKNLST